MTIAVPKTGAMAREGVTKAREAARLVVLACTLAQSLLLLQQWSSPAPAQQWQALASSECSKHGDSVPLNDDPHLGFNLSRPDCRASCARDPECRMYSYGMWVKGWRHYGRMRCQLYAKCNVKPVQGMTIFVKPKGSPFALPLHLTEAIAAMCQFAINILCLVAFLHPSTAVALSVAVAVAAPSVAVHVPDRHWTLVGVRYANAAALLGMTWVGPVEAAQLVTGGTAFASGSKSIAAVPPWRRGDCEAPDWLLFAALASAALELPLIVAFVGEPNWLSLCATALGCSWLLGVAAVALLPAFRDRLLFLAHVLGSTLIVALAALVAQGGASAGMMALMMGHALSMLILVSLDTERRKRTRDVLAAERGRDERERELIALLVDQVRARADSMVDASRWSAIANIVLSGTALCALALTARGVAMEAVPGGGVLPLAGRVLGLNVHATLQYSLISVSITVLSPLIVYFLFRFREGVMRLHTARAHSRAHALKQLAIRTAEFVAERERQFLTCPQICKAPSLGYRVEETTQELPSYVDTSQEPELAGTGSAEASKPSVQGCEDPAGEHFEFAAGAQRPSRESPCLPSGEELRGWVHAQARRLLEHRLGEKPWSLDHDVVTEEEAGQQQLPEGLRLPDCLTRTAQEAEDEGEDSSGEDGCDRSRGFLACTTAAAALLLAWSWLVHAGGPLSPADSQAQRSSCPAAALRWGGALAVGSAALLAVPGFGLHGLAAVNVASALGLGVGGVLTQLLQCWM